MVVSGVLLLTFDLTRQTFIQAWHNTYEIKGVCVYIYLPVYVSTSSGRIHSVTSEQDRLKEGPGRRCGLLGRCADMWRGR